MFKHLWRRIRKTDKDNKLEVRKTDEDVKLEVKKIEPSKKRLKGKKLFLFVKNLGELNVKFLGHVHELDTLLHTTQEIDEQQIHLLRNDCVNIVEEFEKIYLENKDICDEVGINEIIERQVQAFNHLESIIKRIVKKGQAVENEVIYLSLFQFYSNYKKLSGALEKLLMGKEELKGINNGKSR